MSFDLGSAVGVLTLDTTGFSRGLQTAQQGFRQFLDGTNSVSDRITGLGSVFTNVGTKMTLGITAPLAGFGAMAVKEASQFESAMANVASTMGATADEWANGSERLNALEEAIREAGRTTEWTATQAADAMNYMLMSGMDYTQAIEDLPYFLNLATASGMDLARATDVITDAMAALGIATTADNVEHFGDVLVRTSQKSNTSVAQLGDALLQIGPTARDFSGGIEEVSTMLGLLANQGTKGAEAGTILRNVLSGLNGATKKGAKEMEALGIEVYDTATGDMRPMIDIMQDLNVALEDASKEERFKVLKNIFNIYNVAGARSLMAQSVTNIEQLIALFEDAGMSSDEAAAMIDKMAQAYAEAGQDTDKYNEIINSMGLSAEQTEVALGGISAVIEGQSSIWSDLANEVANADGAMQNVVDIRLDTLEGQAKILKSAFSDFAIAVGKVLIPYIEQLVNKGQELFTWLGGLDEETKDLIVKAGLLVAALGPALSIFGGLVKNITPLIPLFTKVVGALGKVIGVFKLVPTPINIVIGLATALYLAYKNNFLGFADLVNTMWKNVKDGFIKAGEAISNFIQDGAKLFEDLKKSWDDFIAYAPEIPKQFIAGLVNGFKNGWQNVKDTVRNLFNSIVTTSEEALDEHSPSRKAHQIGLYWDMGMAQGIMEGTNLLENGMGYITSIFDNAGDSIADTFQEVGQKGSQQLYSAFAENTVKTLALFQKERDSRIALMKEGTEANVQQIQKEISATQQAYSIKMQLYQAEYNAKIRLIDEQYSAEVEAIQEQIDAIDALNEAEDRQKAEDKYNAEVAKKIAAIDAAEDEIKKQELIAELEEYQEERRQTLIRQDRADQQKALRQSMSDAQKRVQAQKDALQEELEAKQQALQQQRDAELMYMQQMQKLLEEDLALRKELAEVQKEMEVEQERLTTGKLSEEEKKQSQNNLSELQKREKNIKDSMNRNQTEFQNFTPKLQKIGDAYGSVLYQGISSTEGKITNYLDYLLQKAQDVIRKMQEAASAAGEAQSAVADYNYEVANSPAAYSADTGNTYNFYSNERLTEAEISRQFRKQQQDLALGF